MHMLLQSSKVMQFVVPTRALPERKSGYTRLQHGCDTEHRTRAHSGTRNETALVESSTTDRVTDRSPAKGVVVHSGPSESAGVVSGGASATSIETERPTLLERVGRGEPGAVTACIDRFGGLVWTLARRMSPTNTDAEDAVQEIFTEIWQHADRYDPSVASETAFVAMITRRRLIDRYRRSSRAPTMMPVDEKFDSPTLGISDSRIELSVQSARVLAAMQSLSKDQQQVLRLSLMQGLSHEKIARSLEMPLGTVKTHARRGLIRLRETLKSTSSATGSGPTMGQATHTERNGGDVPGGAS